MQKSTNNSNHSSQASEYKREVNIPRQNTGARKQRALAAAAHPAAAKAGHKEEHAHKRSIRPTIPCGSTVRTVAPSWGKLCGHSASENQSVNITTWPSPLQRMAQRMYKRTTVCGSTCRCQVTGTLRQAPIVTTSNHYTPEASLLEVLLDAQEATNANKYNTHAA